MPPNLPGPAPLLVKDLSLFHAVARWLDRRLLLRRLLKLDNDSLLVSRHVLIFIHSGPAIPVQHLEANVLITSLACGAGSAPPALALAQPFPHSPSTMHFTSSTVLLAASLFSLVNTHGLIRNVTGANGVQGAGFAVDPTTPRDGSSPVPFEQASRRSPALRPQSLTQPD